MQQEHIIILFIISLSLLLDCCCCITNSAKKRAHEWMHGNFPGTRSTKAYTLFWMLWDLWVEGDEESSEMISCLNLFTSSSWSHREKERACLVLFSEFCVRGAFIWEKISSFLVRFFWWCEDEKRASAKERLRRRKKNWYDFLMMVMMMTIIYSVRSGEYGGGLGQAKLGEK